MGPTTLAAQKAKIRAGLKQIRGALPAEIRVSAARKIAEHLLSLVEVEAVRAVFIYISHGNEVDTRVLLGHFLGRGMMVAVPKILPDKTMIAVRFSSWGDLTPGELGILTPSASVPCPGPFDIAITPGLGFTIQGHRIGYGRGYYDRWFMHHRGTRKIALAYEAQVIDEIPHDENDIPVDILVTEKH
ncbi:MAG: 5-formyltetrahydrofolate cyclo-ligase, partial [Gammaproteobacteria bacterium]